MWNLLVFIMIKAVGLFFDEFAFGGGFFLEVFLFLVPTPFVDLALRESCDCGHSDDFLLGPIGFAVEFLLKNFDLGCAFSFSLSYSILILPEAVVLWIGIWGAVLWVASHTLISHLLVVLFLHYHVLVLGHETYWRRKALYLAAQQLAEQVLLYRGRR